MKDKFILCFCGRMSDRTNVRDMKSFQVVAELEGHLTFTPLFLDNLSRRDNLSIRGVCVDLLTTQTRQVLKENHYQKILLSDIVIIFDRGEIGKDVADEKEFAVSHHKSIRYMSDICPNRTIEEFQEFLTHITEI